MDTTQRVISSFAEGADEPVVEIREFNPARIRPLPGQPRKRFRGIAELAISIKMSGQHTPGLVSIVDGEPEFDAELVDGERRLRACLEAGVSFRAEVRHGLSYRDKFMLSLAKNFGRDDHTSTEVAQALARAIQGGETPERLAGILSKSIGWVHMHLSLNKLDPYVFSLLEAAEHNDQRSFLNFSTAQTLVNLPAKEQRAFARRIMKGGFRSLEHLRREILSHAQKRGIKVAQRQRTAPQRLEDLEKLIDKSTHRFGIYIDMPPDALNELIAAASREELRGLLTSFKTLIADTKGLYEAILHRSQSKNGTMLPRA